MYNHFYMYHSAKKSNSNSKCNDEWIWWCECKWILCFTRLSVCVCVCVHLLLRKWNQCIILWSKNNKYVFRVLYDFGVKCKFAAVAVHFFFALFYRYSIFAERMFFSTHNRNVLSAIVLWSFHNILLHFLQLVLNLVCKKLDGGSYVMYNSDERRKKRPLSNIVIMNKQRISRINLQFVCFISTSSFVSP